MTKKVLSPVKYCPKSEADLFSMTCELSQGEKEYHIKKGDELVVFHHSIRTKQGYRGESVT